MSFYNRLGGMGMSLCRVFLFMRRITKKELRDPLFALGLDSLKGSLYE